MVRKSLAFRIVALSGIWIIMTLVVTALLLVYLYRDHIAQHFDAHVLTHVEELASASKVSPDGRVGLTSRPSDPRFHQPYSGWYWEIRQSGETLMRSQSLGDSRLDLENLPVTEGTVVHEIIGPARQQLRVQTMELALTPSKDPLLFVASSPVIRIADDVRDFSGHVLTSFLILGAGLLLAVVVQVRLALKPLNSISAGIADIRDGRAMCLPESYPGDVQPLVDELNNLLEHNTVLLKRARNQLGDLAHSVKNPLTIINNEAHNMEPAQGQLILQQTSDIANNVDHYLSRARAFGTENVLGLRSHVKTVVDDLAFVMKRIYQDRELKFDFSELHNCWFRGESQDLEEMLGNLMDNACKWAKSRVIVHCSTNSQRLLLVVEDDGPGIPGDHVELALQRGKKLDDSVPGHGLGLGIVEDIATLYAGKLTLGRSEYGGVRAELNLPGV